MSHIFLGSVMLAPAVATGIRREVHDAFHVNADDWKGTILGQFRALTLQTIYGLGA